MAIIYSTIFGKDLHESWVDSDFEDIVPLAENKPEDIAKIESSLVADMKQETKDRKFEKIVRTIILKIAESKKLGRVVQSNQRQKATYTFSMKSGKAQKVYSL